MRHDYLVHAYLQLGENAQAQRNVTESASVKINPAATLRYLPKNASGVAALG